MQTFVKAILPVLLLFSTPAIAQDVLINEILSSNQSVNADQDGEYSDWIELYNSGTTSVNLEGYGLSDSFSEPFRWQFPPVELPAGAYLLVWASGKDQDYGELHTSFSIDSQGEEIILTHTNGTTLDSLSAVEISPDISYGRQPDGTANFKFFDEPTPGYENNTQGYSSILTQPVFSANSGFYNNSFLLEIGSSDQGVNIYYTLDGSVPGPYDYLYTQPIEIKSRAGDPNDISMIPTNNNNDPGPPYYEGWQAPSGEVFKVNVIRAVALRDGDIPSEVSTATYLVDSLGAQRYTLPVFSMTTDRENFFDPETGIYVPGNNNNFFQTGPEWERQVHIEFFEADGSHGFSQDIGVRIHGGTTRSRPRKSLRLYARGEYGENRINYQLFPDKPVRDFNRLLLRNSGNDWDWAIIRDAFLQHLAKDLNVDIQYYRPSILFLNGEYWGIHNIRDRIDADYVETHYGVDSDEIVILRNNAEYYDGNPQGQQHYQDMISFVNQNPLSDDDNYGQLTSMIDPRSFMDGFITNIFVMNTDWPGNNIQYWRRIKEHYDPMAGPEHDGRWRWMLLDLDFGFGLPFFYVPGVDQGPAHNTLQMAADANGPSWPNPPWSTLLFRKLLENNTFRNNFINRFCDLMNSSFHQNTVVELLDSVQQILQPEMQEHIDRWRRPVTVADWEDNLDVMRNFAIQRPVYMRAFIKEYFNLQDTAVVTLAVNDNQMGDLKINTIDVNTEDSWSGIYFQGVPVKIIARPHPGHRFVEWQGVSALNTDTLQLVLTSDISVTAVFAPDDDFAGDEMNPVAHKLAHGDYVFSFWDPNEPEGSFPDHMVFQQSSMDDPDLEDQMTEPYNVPYLEYHDDDMGNVGFPYMLSRRTRINGLWDEGISFINTGRERDLGAAVLAIDTRDAYGISVSWLGGTLIANSRAYAIRLQYRTSLQGEFEDVLDHLGNPVEYMRSDTEGHFTRFESIELPSQTDNQPYVQLRWKYYYTGEQISDESGSRDMLRLDDIRVKKNNSTTVQPPDNDSYYINSPGNFPNPFSESTTIHFELKHSSHVRLSVHNQQGAEMVNLMNKYAEPGRHEVTFSPESLPPGVYFFRLVTDFYSASQKMVIIK